MQKRFRVISFFLFLFFIHSFAAAQPKTDEMKSHFVTTWKTDNKGQSGPTSIILSINPKFSYKYDVDWNNDGVFDEFSLAGKAEHSYSKPGVYTVRIRGEYPALQITTEEPYKILRVDQWGSNQWSSFGSAFAEASNLTVTATDIPDLSKVDDLGSMFAFCRSVDPDVSQWDVSNVKNMSYLFSHCHKANPDVSKWDLSKVKTTSYMFSGTNCDPDVSKWNVSNVEDMSGMFYGANKANPNVKDWRTNSLTDMGGMFTNAKKADPDFTDWSFHSIHSDNKYFDFRGSAWSPKNYDIFLNKFAKYKNLWGASVNVGSLRSEDPEGARKTLSKYYKWRITDGDS